MKKVILFLVLLSTAYSSASISIIGRVIDQNGNGVENVKIINKRITTVTSATGEYIITVPTDNVGIDNNDINLSYIRNFKITVYNLLGQKIFDQDYQNTSIQEFSWRGKNQDGEFVSSGLYFPILKVNNQVIAKGKITVLGNMLLNNRPFFETNQGHKKNEIGILNKLTTFNSIYFDLEGENFTKINGLGVNISDYNSDNIYEAEDIQVKTYEIGTVTDIDGNVYKTVKIGNQWWMAENLRVTHYRNGDPIEYIKDRYLWYNTNKDYISAYCFFKNDTSYIADYGNFYNWYALTDEREIAPEGWHIPTKEDFLDLKSFVGKGVGKKLKSTDEWFSYWKGEGAGTDEFGFCGKPVGYITDGGTFKIFGETAGFWTSTEISTNRAIFFTLYIRSSSLGEHEYNKVGGFSIRCIKNGE